MTRNRTRTFAVGLLAPALLTMAARAADAQTAKLDPSVTLNGQGSSFVSNFLEQCKAGAKTSFGVNVSYQPTGSGAGRTSFIEGTVDFAASDVPFSLDEAGKLKGKKFVYLPVTAGGIAVAYNVPGVTDLTLSGPTVAKIFGGKIVKWNDASIAKENPKAKLPNQVIRVVVRSDSSGTSNVFGDYLTAAGKGAWTKGAQNTFPVPPGNGIAQKGSDGVTNFVQSAQGAYGITYAEVSFARERKLAVAKIVNAAGKAVGPDAANVTATMAAAKVNPDGTVKVDYATAAPTAYPISTTSYVIAPRSIATAKGDVLRTFLTYSLGACQAKSASLGYAPLPTSMQSVATKAIAAINPGSAPVPTVKA